MSGEKGTLGVELSVGVALEDGPRNDGHGRAETGSRRRSVHRIATATLLLGMVATLGGWVVLLGWSAVWLWGALPF